MSFPYKTALITGASSGIGLALAERIIEAGVFVIAVGRRKERLDGLVAKHGADKVVAEVHNVADLDGLPAWTKKITTAHPTLDCIILNAGEQNQTPFASLTQPGAANLAATQTKMADIIARETTLNYVSPVQTVIHFLPHLSSLSSPAGIILVSSGLALVPIQGCANYCATKAALHSFAWTLRQQLRHWSPSPSTSSKISVIEIIPPMVQTELHSRQGLSEAPGMPLDAFTDETWEGLTREGGPPDEIIVGRNKQYAPLEDGKRVAFQQFDEMLRKMQH